MKKSTKWILIAIVVLLVIIFWNPIKSLFASKVTKAGLGPGVNTGSNAKKNPTNTNQNHSDFPLRKGVKNDKVKELQEALNNLSGSPRMPLIVDGSFGQKTLDRLKLIAGDNWTSIDNQDQLDQIKYQAMMYPMSESIDNSGVPMPAGL